MLKFYFSVLIFIFTILTSFQVSANCSFSTNSSILQKTFLEYLDGQTAKSKQKIAILPFFDNTTEKADPILSYGIPFLIYDTYSEKNDVIHPYVSFSHVRELGLANTSLYDAEAMKNAAQKTGTRYIVFGIVQRANPTQIRVAINVYDNQNQTHISPASEFAVSLDDSFFSHIRQNFESAMKKAKQSVKASTHPDPSFAPFRYYVRGLQLSENYDQTTLNLATVWFEKALKESFHKYDDAALGLARVQFMKSLLQKLNQQDYTTEWLKAKDTLQYIRNRNSGFKYKLVDRYVAAHHNFLQAATAVQVKNFGRAEKAAFDTLTLLPEDALAEQIYHESVKTLGRLGKRKAVFQECTGS